MKKYLLLCMLLHMPIFSQDIVRQELTMSVNQAVSKLKQTLKGKQITIFTVINHKKTAQTIDLTMNPSQVIIFGNPKMGTELMKDNMQWSYELPLKIAIYQDNQGKVWAQTRLLTKDIDSSKQTPRINKINKLLQELVLIK